MGNYILALDQGTTSSRAIVFDAGGLPVGVQVLGSRFSDHVTLAVGKALEEAYGGWRPANI